VDQARRSCGRLIAREGSVTSGDPVRARHSDRLIVRHSRMEPPHLPTENLARNRVRRGGRWSSLVPSHNESSPKPGLIRCVRCISRGDKDSLAERGGFELSVRLVHQRQGIVIRARFLTSPNKHPACAVNPNQRHQANPQIACRGSATSERTTSAWCLGLNDLTGR